MQFTSQYSASVVFYNHRTFIILPQFISNSFAIKSWLFIPFYLIFLSCTWRAQRREKANRSRRKCEYFFIKWVRLRVATKQIYSNLVNCNRCQSIYSLFFVIRTCTTTVVNLIKHFTIIIYDSRVVLTTKLPIWQL